jgi:hypothetical protein
VKLSRYAKAIVAALAAASAAAATAAQDGVISGQEWTTIIVAAIGTLGVTWAVPNKTAQDGDRGEQPS